MVALSQFTPKNSREQAMLALGFIAVLIGVYFFVIEPLEKKTRALQNTSETRTAQLGEMQSMASELLNQPSQPQKPRDLLAGKIASETLESGKRVLKTQALNTQDAKKLLVQLAGQGRVEIHAIDSLQAEVWFWEK